MTTFTKGQKVRRARGSSRYIRIGEEVTVASVAYAGPGDDEYEVITLEGHGDKEFLADDFEPVEDTPAPLKPGQVWAATADPEETYRVIEVRDGDVWSENRYGSHVVISASLFPNDRQLVTDATPAPLDPSKVKAGDTVTLERDGGRLPDQEVVTPSVTMSGRTTLILKGGIEVIVTGPDAWTLTAHQPAPEPEPEWKPGALVAGTVNERTVRGFVGQMATNEHGFTYWNQFAGHVSFTSIVPADVRPLVVIDPAKVYVEDVASAIAHELGLMPNEVEPMHREAAVGAIRVLGIEVAR